MDVRHWGALALLLAGACRGDRPAPKPKPNEADAPREATEGGDAAKSKAPRTPKNVPPSDTPPELLLMIVMDTVRADHLKLCGYKRPTSPQLENLKERGAVVSCNAYSPASWTLPSHGSYFTGMTVPEHGLSLAPESALAVNPNVNVRPLDPSVETLAEKLKARGFQTAFLSGNPIIKGETGLHQGFDTIKVAEPQGGGLRGDALAAALKELLGTLDANKPLFLFVNVYDAHDPYPAVPEEVGWLPTWPEMRISPTKADDTNEYYRFFEGKMSQKERETYLDHVVDTYDWGIRLADESVGNVMATVREMGFSDKGVRMVVTADHGELLGEHRLLRHGGYVYEGVTRVPFLWFDNQKQTQIALPESFSATEAFWLLLDGKLQEEHVQASAVSSPNPSFFQKGVSAVAVWDGHQKGVWEGGTTKHFDVQADPTEREGKPLEPGKLADDVAKMKAAYDEMDKRPVPTNENLGEALKAMGYAQ